MNFLIWSIEHGAWWGPNRRGYTTDVRAAGRYSYEVALDIVEDANVAWVNECLIPEACVQLAPPWDKLAALEARASKLEARLNAHARELARWEAEADS